MIRGFWRIYEAVVNTAAVILFSGMVGVTAGGVFFLDNAPNAALPWAEEADRYLFIWLTFIGASVTMRYKARHRCGCPRSLLQAPFARMVCPHLRGMRAWFSGVRLLGQWPRD